MDFSNQWKNIIDTLQDGIIIVDTAGVIQTVNPSAERLTGYSRNELVGSSCRILNCTGCKIIGNGSGPDYCKLFSVGRSKMKQCRITNKFDNSVHILKSASVLENEQGVAIGAVEVLTDMTAIKTQQEEIKALRERLREEDAVREIVGRSPAIEKLTQVIKSVSRSETPVLIHGESGTGKELVARAVHDNSPRGRMPFVKVNCAALNENLFESELFGHVKGSFTGADRHRIGRFEAANGGTLFLDEIGEISLNMQVKLLRVLEEREIERVGSHTPVPIDVRIICATNKDLEEEVRAGRFRKDLYFRINVFPIRCPSLVERKPDIPLIVRYFINRNAAGGQKEITGVSPEVMEMFLEYRWPGNVRELRNTIEYAFVLCPGGMIEKSHIPGKLTGKGSSHGVGPEDVPSSNPQREKLLNLLREVRGNRSELARRLGISRVTLWKRIKEHQIRIPEDI